jgi:glycosyltransferase involved in cell wall biosynthesis
MVFRFPDWAKRKSNGVKVNRATYRHIRSADGARSRSDWITAARHYKAALSITPALPHIWMQLGHAAKESGRISDATNAYEQAALLSEGDPEPHMFLGHMAKRLGAGESGQHYLAALRRAPDNLAAVGEVMQHLLSKRQDDDTFLDEALSLLGIDRAAVEGKMVKWNTELPEGALFFDVTDLISYFSFSRIPSGVQRVQIELILALLATESEQKIEICYYSSTRQGWTLLSHKTFVDLCVASLRDVSHSQTGWAHELRVVYITSALSEEIIFPHHSVLVSLGANAPDGNYLLDVRTTCERCRISYVPLIYDLIPMIHPEWVVPAHARDFSLWLQSMLHSARGYLSISHATRSDLLRYATAHGISPDPNLVRVVPIDGNSIKPASASLPRKALDRWGLTPDAYVIFVSTIEPRKNHIGAFKAWLRLSKEIGEGRLPTLVCIGGKGWLNDEVYALHDRHATLRRKVKILSGISDEELDLLYRNCAFTVYPSFYEGWGLPITESLCYGKVPAISNSTSMPEAGGEFAVYFDPHDPNDIAAQLKPLILDTSLRLSLEKKIENGFHAPTWAEAGRIMASQALAIADRLASIPRTPPIAVAKTVYRFALPTSYDPSDKEHGEIFRHGRGWHLPDLAGCRVRDEGGELRMRIVGDIDAVLIMKLAATERVAPFRIVIGDRSLDGHVPARSSLRVSFPVGHHTDNLAVHITTTGSAVLRVVEFMIASGAERSDCRNS